MRLDQALPVIDAIGLDEGAAEHVGEAAVVAVGRLPRRQQIDDVLETALPQVAVAEQQARARDAAAPASMVACSSVTASG